LSKEAFELALFPAAKAIFGSLTDIDDKEKKATQNINKNANAKKFMEKRL
jgi:hypothetical protein